MPKMGRNYSMYNKEGRHVERMEEGFFESLSGEKVQVHLLSGKEIAGILSASTYNRYDITLENSEEQYLVPKAGIEYVRRIPDTKEVIRK